MRDGLNVVYTVAVEINDWKAQAIVTPDQFAISDVERSKLRWLKIRPYTRVARSLQERAKVNCLHSFIVELNRERIVARLCDGHDIDRCCVHFNLFVMRSGDTDLWSTKKSIHLATISSALAVTISWK